MLGVILGLTFEQRYLLSVRDIEINETKCTKANKIRRFAVTAIGMFICVCYELFVKKNATFIVKTLFKRVIPTSTSVFYLLTFNRVVQSKLGLYDSSAIIDLSSKIKNQDKSN